MEPPWVFIPPGAAIEKRIRCTIGSSSPASECFLSNKMNVNPILLKGIPPLVRAETYSELLEFFNLNIGGAPPIDRPLLIFHSGKDRLIPNDKGHADTFMKWAKGEKGLKYYQDGTHVCANYLDEADAYMIDWLRKHL